MAVALSFLNSGFLRHLDVFYCFSPGNHNPDVLFSLYVRKPDRRVGGVYLREKFAFTDLLEAWHSEDFCKIPGRSLHSGIDEHFPF